MLQSKSGNGHHFVPPSLLILYKRTQEDFGKHFLSLRIFNSSHVAVAKACRMVSILGPSSHLVVERTSYDAKGTKKTLLVTLKSFYFAEKHLVL